MSELILELYSEEIPPNLQINARNDLHEKIKSSLKGKLKIWLFECIFITNKINIIIKRLFR